MNIMHFISSFRTGGAEKLLIDLVKETYLKEGYKIQVCIINDQYENDLLKLLAQYSDLNRIDRKEGSKKPIYIYKILKLVKEKNIKIIHCHDRGSYKFAVICKKIFKNIKIVYTIHDTKIYTQLEEKDILQDKKNVDKFIAISKAVKKDILSRGIDNQKVKLIHNGIDIDKFYYKHKDDKNNIIIGNVARVIPEKKGQDILINAISIVKSKYPNIKCQFAGDVPTVNGIRNIKIIDELKELAISKDVSDNIEFLGSINDIPKFLSNIDIFVLPSRYEGFGLALIEAMASKIPVISSNIDGPLEIIKNEEYGLIFEQDDYIDLANKIIAIIENKDIIDVDKAYKYVKNTYSINSMYMKYTELYKEIQNI